MKSDIWRPPGDISCSEQLVAADDTKVSCAPRIWGIIIIIIITCDICPLDFVHRMRRSLKVEYVMTPRQGYDLGALKASNASLVARHTLLYTVHTYVECDLWITSVYWINTSLFELLLPDRIPFKHFFFQYPDPVWASHTAHAPRITGI